MKIRHLFFICSLIGLCGFCWPYFWQKSCGLGVIPPVPPEKVITLPPKINSKAIVGKTSNWVEEKLTLLKRAAPSIDSNILRLSLMAYQKAAHSKLLQKQNLLTIIDYSQPSTVKRLWVFDLQNNKPIFNTWVSHGRNSGGLIPTSFSNTIGSLKSSIGVFLTDTAYYGGRGYSLRIKGLEQGINDKVYERHVVFHGAWYMNPDTIRKFGRAGRSWGCPAVSDTLIRPLINTIKDKSLLFVYYPDKNWLKRSQFLAG